MDCLSKLNMCRLNCSVVMTLFFCSGDNVVNSLLLTALIDSTMDYSDHILYNPIKIYFLPTPLVSWCPYT